MAPQAGGRYFDYVLKRLQDRGMPLGSALLALGGGLTIAYLVFVLQDDSRSFWRWPGIIGLTLLVLGAASLLAGFLAPVKQRGKRKPRSGQSQTAGSHSQLFMAGRDVRVGDVYADERNAEPTDGKSKS